MRTLSILAMLILAGCASPTTPVARAEISEQLVLTVNRPGSRVLRLYRHQGDIEVKTGKWTANFSPGWGHVSKDTVETVCMNWVKAVWNIDTPEEGRLIGIALTGFPVPDTAIGPFPTPGERLWKFSTGVRDPRFSSGYTTPDTSVVRTKIHNWLNGTWDIDNPNERYFVLDTMDVSP